MTTGIEWTDETWNPVTGCTKVSPGCDHCYAKTMHERFNGPGSFDAVTLHPDRLDKPLHWRKPRRVFVNSMSDLFHDDVPDGFIAWVFYVMSQCPQHTFQVLTKRHARMRSFMQRWADRSGDRAHDKPDGMPPMPRGPEAIRSTYTSGRALLFADMLEQWGPRPEGGAYPLYDWVEGLRFWPETPFNVWLGVSVEDQQWADIRIPALLETPAAVRFLSCEPLLGPVNLRGWTAEAGMAGVCFDIDGQLWHKPGSCPHCRPRIDWVIVGGESGPGARPMPATWARLIRDQCVAAGVPFFFKQFGEYAPTDILDPRAIHVPSQMGNSTLACVKVGKKAAGRELDGRTWDEYPAVASC